MKKASQDEQQYQSTKATNINYIQHFMTILKKHLQTLKIASDKTETKQNNFYFNRKDMVPLYKKAQQPLDKKEQLKTIIFNVKKPLDGNWKQPIWLWSHTLL